MLVLGLPKAGCWPWSCLGCALVFVHDVRLSDSNLDVREEDLDVKCE